MSCPRSDGVPDFDQRTLFFTHIPKCGGTTLINIFKDVYGEDRVLYEGDSQWTAFDALAFRSSDLARYQAVCGHFVYGMHERFRQAPLYVSLVRDPIDRCSSAIRFIQSVEMHYLHPLLSGKSMDECVEILLQNGEYRLIGRQCEFLCQLDDFEFAKEKIEGRYFLVAPLERFDDFVSILECLVFKKSISYHRANVSAIESSAPFSLKTQDLIRSVAQEDFKLVEYVKERFEARWGYFLSRIATEL